MKKLPRWPLSYQLVEAHLMSDGIPFSQAGVPTVSTTSGTHGDWHEPSDVAGKVSPRSLAAVAKLQAELARALSTRGDTLAGGR